MAKTQTRIKHHQALAIAGMINHSAKYFKAPLKESRTLYPSWVKKIRRADESKLEALRRRA